MSFNFLNQGQGGNIQQFTPIDTFIDPVSKIRVSNPSNLIDTDFEYGLQPTKWETVELINNTPAFFSKSGDTTIADITAVTTNEGTREITVETAFPHNLDVGIPIRVSGTRSVTADGSYIINATPSPTTFTYLSRANQPKTESIFDLYTSIITGEFFQGSQISIDDADGIITNAQGPNSELTVKTPNQHGFGPKTPFYFLNLNSTVAKEFRSNNNTSVSFDPTNAATAQTFDGSNTSLRNSIDLSNSATTSTINHTVFSTSPQNQTFTININSLESQAFAALKENSPLYYSFSAGAGYFQKNPRGVIFIRGNAVISGNQATFTVSAIPDGPILVDEDDNNSNAVVANITGFFRIADQAIFFPGNNVDVESQLELEVIADPAKIFDGANQGFTEEGGVSNQGVLNSQQGSEIRIFVESGEFDGYPGAMIQYTTTGNAAGGLVNNRSYFIKTFVERSEVGVNVFGITIAELPGGADITINLADQTGTGTFKKIGIAVDKNIFHIKDANFSRYDMLEYSYPTSGRFGASVQKDFYFVDEILDIHNYRLSASTFVPISATGGNISETYLNNRIYKVHSFTNVGTTQFNVSSIGTEGDVEYLVVGGGGSGGSTTTSGSTGGGGGGGVLTNVGGSPLSLSPGSYTVTVGAGGSTAASNLRGNAGGASTFGPITVSGGSGGGGSNGDQRNSLNGASSGGAAKIGTAGAGVGTAIAGQGNIGRESTGLGTNVAGGGGGSESAATNQNGGNGRVVNITGSANRYGGGGGGGSNGAGGLGGGGAAGNNLDGAAGTFATGGGGGGVFRSSGTRIGGAGGSGFVAVRYPITPSLDNFIDASGGTTVLVTEGGVRYRRHTFTNVGNTNFVVSSIGQDNPLALSGEIEYLVVGGGGQGGTVTSNGSSGGGGAGGVLNGKLRIPSTGVYTVTVGAGGTGGAANQPGNAGGTSSIGSLISASGGSGGGGRDTRNSANGASSGGAGKTGTTGGTSGTAIAGQGNRGSDSTGLANNISGGGGGAGSATSNQNGGAGRSISITGGPIIYGGGGGGGSNGVGGSGGGGNAASNANGAPGQANTGGGGGGVFRSSGTRVGGDGGSGIVIIKYPVGLA
jgi:hypothetical protein